MVDVKALIAEARLPERSVDVCLRPDLTARLQELERDLATAEEERLKSGSLASGSESRIIAEEIEAVRDQMVEHTLKLRVRALPRRAFTALIAEHPPRPDNELDKAQGLNTDTFFDALVRSSVAEPALDDADWAALDGVLSDGQWQELASAAWGVNRRDVDVPFSRRASRILSSSEGESKPPSGSASPSSASTGGSQTRRRSTSKTKPAS